MTHSTGDWCGKSSDAPSACSTASNGKAWCVRNCWEGAIGTNARAMGGATLPLYAHFAPVHELFLKPAAETVY